MSALGDKISYGCPLVLLGQGGSSPAESCKRTSWASDKDLRKPMNNFHIYLHSFTIVVFRDKDIAGEIG